MPLGIGPETSIWNKSLSTLKTRHCAESLTNSGGLLLIDIIMQPTSGFRDHFAPNARTGQIMDTLSYRGFYEMRLLRNLKPALKEGRKLEIRKWPDYVQTQFPQPKV